MALRAVRGATTVERDEREHVLERTRELIGELVAANGLDPDDVISVIFSATPDVSSVAPALAARQLGWTDVALLCVTEMPVEGSMPLVVRLLAHLDVQTPREQLRNVYLHGTHLLRADVPAVPAT